MIVPALFLLTTSISLWPKALSHTVSFGSDQPIVGTYFFYWYDIHTKGHFLNHDGTDALVDHPTNPNDYSYNSVNWWKRELHDVISAKVDFILPVYWGIPNRQNDPKFHDAWSFSGLPKLVEAWDQIAGQGNHPPPRIGMFYDTSTLELNPDRFHVDLTTSEGKQWFYETIRDFFSLVPPRTWAMIDQKPIIFLYSASFAKKQDPEIFDYVRRNFKTDFTCEPFIVKEISWHGDADATYAWGGAVSPRWNDVTALGPGYTTTTLSRGANRSSSIARTEIFTNVFGDLFSHNIQHVDPGSSRSKRGTNFTKEPTFAIQSSTAGNTLISLRSLPTNSDQEIKSQSMVNFRVPNRFRGAKV